MNTNQMHSLIRDKENEIGEALRQKGYWHGEIVDPSLALQLLDYANVLKNENKLSEAAIGAAHNTVRAQSIRGDNSYWINREHPIEAAFMAQMDQLKSLLESYFPIPLSSFEGHFSVYPIGTCYQTHLDNARQRNSRIFSIVNYFNRNWKKGDGGELVLYAADSTSVIDTIEPHFGTTVIFFSEDFPHEVLTTQQVRFSATGWFHHAKRS